MIKKRAYIGGEKDEIEICKILRWKSEDDKLYTGLVIVELT